MKARQRASVKWILSKAYNNRVPENQREPFYRDHEGQDHLKPQVCLANPIFGGIFEKISNKSDNLNFNCIFRS